MRYFFHLLMLTLALACGPALPAQAAPDPTVKIGSYNVANFFDVFDDPYTEDEGSDVKPRADIEKIAAALRELDADVVVFQELENRHVLQAMVDQFLFDQGYQYVASQPTNSGRGINLGVISRLPIKSLRSYRFDRLTNPDAPGREWRFARDVMQLTIDAGGEKPIEVLCVHLKSNRDGPDDPNSRLYRTAEAMRVKQIVLEMVKQDNGTLAAVLGDFNSNYETRPEQDCPWPAMAHLRRTPEGGRPLFYDVHERENLSHQQRVTIPGSGRYPPATFDYILTTPALFERYVEGSATIISDPKLTAGSDHYPIAATFRVE